MPAPDPVSRDLAAEVESVARARLDPQTAAEVITRATTLLPAAVATLRSLYGTAADGLVRDLVGDLVDLTAARPDELRELDRERAADPGWFRDPGMLGYVCYVDRFGGTLAGVREHFDHLQDLGVGYLHLMAVLQPRSGDSDGGYAIADYDAVDPDLGTMAELTDLAHDLHGRGAALCVDFVLNHTAREHEWARAAMAGDEHYRRFYFVYPDRREPDEWERTVPDIFPQLAPGSFTFVPELDGWVWTTFRDFQWDLDYRNPDVFRAMVRTMITLANRGPDVLRLDAAPFLWKEQGTDCQNLPQTHLLLQALRTLLSIVAPGVLLKAEAMVDPELLTPYLGAHADGFRPECDLAYDNQLMVMLWSMLATGSGELAGHALARRPPAPPTTSWITYLRCHDDIGWAVSDADARAVGLDGPLTRRTLSSTFAGGGPWDSEGAVFQPRADGAGPISGMTAALTGLSAARAAGDDAAVDFAIDRIDALYSIVLSFGGLPVIYMGDEIGLGNDRDWERDPAHAGDNRWLHRPPMDWAAVARAREDPASVEGRSLRRLAELGRARAALPALRAGVPATIVDAGDGLFGYERGPVDGRRVHCVVDVRGTGATVHLGSPDHVIAHSSAGVLLDAGTLTLPPYGYAWTTR